MTGKEVVKAYIEKFGGFPYEIDVADDEADTERVRILVECIRTGHEYTYEDEPGCDY